jgi:hypothetical protein
MCVLWTSMHLLYHSRVCSEVRILYASCAQMIVISRSSAGYNPVLACIISTSYFTSLSFSTHLPFFVVDRTLVLARPRKAKAITASTKYLWRKTQQTSLDRDTPFAFAFAPTVRKNRTVHIFCQSIVAWLLRIITA